MSPPSREAWIEIGHEAANQGHGRRRLPHGRRGLKLVLGVVEAGDLGSPPSREAWIEISASVKVWAV